ncbi:MAG TPA: carboxypeptidase-like regulatory domain-containing protein [Thermoplasmata archaeon]|nr:carboxypeptidase-like regulatory domain-containing protein [Thermoplasmata archaeon]
MKQAILLPLLLILIGGAFAMGILQAAPPESVSGRVTDSCDGHALSGVHMEIIRWNTQTGQYVLVWQGSTSTSGEYATPALDPGFYIVSAEPGFGYYDQTANAEVIEGQSSTTISDFALFNVAGCPSGSPPPSEGPQDGTGDAVDCIANPTDLACATAPEAATAFSPLLIALVIIGLFALVIIARR